MATTVLLALFASVFLRAVLTLPVAQDLKSVNNSVILKRFERDVVRGYYNCGQGMVWLLDLLICVPIEKYKEASADDYEEMNGSQDESNTSHPIKTTTQATMMPHNSPTTQAYTMPQPVPKSPPDGTPHSPTRSTPKPTLSADSTTPSLLPLQVTSAAQTSASPTTRTAILLMLSIALFYRTV